VCSDEISNAVAQGLVIPASGEGLSNVRSSRGRTGAADPLLPVASAKCGRSISIAGTGSPTNIHRSGTARHRSVRVMSRTRTARQGEEADPYPMDRPHSSSGSCASMRVSSAAGPARSVHVDRRRPGGGELCDDISEATRPA
jgi:hypothetical protein